MLIHCVTLTFKESASTAQIEAFRDALAALPDQADFPLRICQGRDLGERPTNADYAIVTEFEKTEDFYTYLKHPAHLALPQDHIKSVQSVQFLVNEQG